jgi:hypothetical protein
MICYLDAFVAQVKVARSASPSLNAVSFVEISYPRTAPREMLLSITSPPWHFSWIMLFKGMLMKVN